MNHGWFHMGTRKILEGRQDVGVPITPFLRRNRIFDDTFDAVSLGKIRNISGFKHQNFTKS